MTITCAVLYLTQRRELAGAVVESGSPAQLSAAGKLTLVGIGIAALALLVSSAFGRDLGAPSLAAALIAIILVMLKDRKAWREAPRNVSWSVLPMVAGLFVVVAAVNKAGVLDASERAITALGRLPAWAGDLTGAFGITFISNLINNLPTGLITGTALAQTPHVSESLRNALLVGVDLGPNLSVTGSLATVLWLIALRREGQNVSAWSFLKVGVLVVPGALILAVLALRF